MSSCRTYLRCVGTATESLEALLVTSLSFGVRIVVEVTGGVFVIKEISRKKVFIDQDGKQ